MDRKDIDILVDRYVIALKREHSTMQDVAKVESGNVALRASIVASGYADSTIDGKNADIRKAQETTLLAENKDYQAALQVEADAREDLATTTVVRKAIEAEIGLVKAWMYSQSGR